MKTMFPLGYHHNGSVATHALGQTIYVLPKCMNCQNAIWAKTGWPQKNGKVKKGNFKNSYFYIRLPMIAFFFIRKPMFMLK